MDGMASGDNGLIKCDNHETEFSSELTEKIAEIAAKISAIKNKDTYFSTEPPKGLANYLASFTD